MNYRKLGGTNLNISEISLGAEHLEDKDPSLINAVVNRALDRGINYIDIVAYTSSIGRDAMGEAIRGRRNDVMISAHLGAVEQDGRYFRTREAEKCETSFEDLLARLHTDFADVLMLHCIDTDQDVEAVFDRNGYLGLALKLKRQGKVRAIALSTHIVPIAERAIESGFVDALMFPVNPAHDLFPGNYGLEEMWDESTLSKLKNQEIGEVTTRADLYRRCESAGIGLIAMKTYAGGLLLPSGPMRKSFEDKGSSGHPAGMALSPVQCISYVLARPGISTALVGCISPKQIDEAVAYYDATESERDFSSIDTHKLWKLAGRCTYCNHCLPCPEDISIGALMRLLDSAELTESQRTDTEYRRLIRHAQDCTKCEICMDRCPFGVRVTDRMEMAVSTFGF